jgi:hypothetical protein
LKFNQKKICTAPLAALVVSAAQAFCALVTPLLHFSSGLKPLLQAFCGAWSTPHHPLAQA